MLYYCVGDLNPLPAEVQGSSVGRALMPRKPTVVSLNPTQVALFSLKRDCSGFVKMCAFALLIIS